MRIDPESREQVESLHRETRERTPHEPRPERIYANREAVRPALKGQRLSKKSAKSGLCNGAQVN